MSGWQAAGGSGGPAGSVDVEPRCGTVRPSMETNVLIHKTPLGKVKKTTFNNSPPDRAYGAVQPPDAEGARAVISTWKGHQPNPHAKPGPDFLAMNKAAAGAGLVSSEQFRTFRAVQPITLRTGVEGVAKPPPELPSDHNPTFTYGLPAAYRTAEVVRSCGPEEPKMQTLVQGAYSSEWVQRNMARKDEFDDRKRWIKARSTGATEGHALGAQRVLAAHEAASTGGSNKQWKMPRFEKHAESKIAPYMHGRSSSPVTHSPKTQHAREQLQQQEMAQLHDQEC